MNSPRLAVVVPSFNGASFIRSAVQSVLVGHQLDIEVCVVDDGSRDLTPSLVAALASEDRRVRLVQHEHAGVAAARNRGILETRAPLLLFLDQDDIKPTGSINMQVAELEADTVAILSIGETLMFGEWDEENQPAKGGRLQQVLTPLLGAGIFRREAFDQYGLFDTSFEMGSDYDFYLRLIEGGRKTIVNHEVTLFHRRHAENSSGNFAKTKMELLKVVQKSLQRRRLAGSTEVVYHPLLTAMRQQWNAERQS